MTDLADHDRQHDVRDEPEAAEFPGEQDDRTQGRADVEYGGEPQVDAAAYPDQPEKAPYQDQPEGVPYQDHPVGVPYQDQDQPVGVPDQDHADADALRTDDAALTRDPEAGLNAGTSVATATPVPGADLRPDAAADLGAGGDPTLAEDAGMLMARWQEVQNGFVDDPQKAMHAADELVQQVMKQVEARIAAERAGMEEQWSRGEDVSTEDLRLMLQRYRTFFNRLLRV